MRSGRLLLFATTAITVTAGSTAARATGLEATFRAGYGSAGDKSPVAYEPTGTSTADANAIWSGKAKPYGAGVVLDAAVGYRPLSFISFGVTGGWRKSAVDSSSIRSQASGVERSGLQAGLYVRGYLPLVGLLTGFDPWASVGANYVYDKQTYDQPTPAPMSVTLTHHGVGVPLAIGIDYRVLSTLAVGPSFQYEIVTGVGGCMTPKHNPPGADDSRQCSDADTRMRVTAAKDYQIWSIGLGLRLAL